MLQAQEKDINGHQYQVTPFPAMKGIRMAVRIAKVVGGGIGSLGKGNILDQDLGAMAGAICSGLDENETPKLIQDLLGSTHRDMKDLSNDKNFNDAFKQNYQEIFPAIAFILEVNYGGFMEALATGNQQFGAVQAPTSPAS